MNLEDIKHLKNKVLNGKRINGKGLIMISNKIEMTIYLLMLICVAISLMKLILAEGGDEGVRLRYSGDNNNRLKRCLSEPEIDQYSYEIKYCIEDDSSNLIIDLFNQGVERSRRTRTKGKRRPVTQNKNKN